MMHLVVVENPRRWPFDVEGVEVVPARSYLVDPAYSELRRAVVFNVCRHYGYQTTGYYVSLLAAARGHRPFPSVATLQSLLLSPLVRLVSEEVDGLMQRGLADLRSDAFDLSIYFGRNLARRHGRLSRALFNQFPAPFLRARFVRDGRWRLHSVRPIATSDIPESHREFVVEAAREYLARPRRGGGGRREYRYDLAVLWREEDENPPSDGRAIRRFVRAARAQGIAASVIGPDDSGRIAEFDALFIRETTSVNHHTYRIASRAAAEGLVVIDDPESILRCTNKVYQAELFRRHRIPCPRTLVVHSGDLDEVGDEVGFPCVVKKPDASFSQGVVRVEGREELRAVLERFFLDSELAVIQAWTPSEFDWRIGVLDRRPLFACKYHMARGHWQIIREDGDAGEGVRYGRVEAVPTEAVPPEIVETAVRAAGLIGEGLYGVDVKEVDDRHLVMEVNDNPNLEAGYEDALLGPALYEAIAVWFRERLDRRGGEGTAHG